MKLKGDPDNLDWPKLYEEFGIANKTDPTISHRKEHDRDDDLQSLLELLEECEIHTKTRHKENGQSKDASEMESVYVGRCSRSG
jgi:hypothetical protein